MHGMVCVIYLDDMGAHGYADPLYIQYECTEHIDHEFYDHMKSYYSAQRK